jgi:hypothetical protein
MANGMPTILQPFQIPSSGGPGWIVPASRRTRPFWFDGRFLAAHDLERDQTDFLCRQARLGRAAGFGVVHGLLVETVAAAGQPPDADSILIRAGQGITPGGGMVLLANDLTVRISDLMEEESLDVAFGLASTPAPVARTRSGLYVLALRPVQFTANPIASYPAGVQGSAATQDGNVIEATAVCLVAFALPSGNADPAAQQGAAAREIFLQGGGGTLSASLLPVAMVCIQRGVLAWLDPYLVRRESGPEFAGLRFGVSGPATQQAFLLQYDAQLQQAVTALTQANQPARILATDYFQALPAAGRLPLASIDPAAATQAFFPPQTQVSLRVIPADELPAVIEDSLALPPIDLTLPAAAYADLSMLALVPVPRPAYAALAAALPQLALTAAVPQRLNSRVPLELLKLFRFGPVAALPSGNWQDAIGAQVYGYYARQRSAPALLSPAVPGAGSTTTLAVAGVGVSGLALTATVSPAGALGTVTFKDGSATLNTVALGAASATLVLPAPAAGPHTFSATYNGNVNLAASTSATINRITA